MKNDTFGKMAIFSKHLITIDPAMLELLAFV